MLVSVYLYGICFKVRTDHKPLEVIYSKTHNPIARIVRCVLIRLKNYDFTVEYLPGPENIADTLSRLFPVKRESSVNEADQYVRFIAENAARIAVPIQEIEEASACDVELSLARNAVQSGKLKELPKEYRNVGNEITVWGKLVYRGARLVIPNVLRTRVLDLAHEGQRGVVKRKQRIRSKVWWPGVDNAVEWRCKLIVLWLSVSLAKAKKYEKDGVSESALTRPCCRFVGSNARGRISVCSR